MSYNSRTALQLLPHCKVQRHKSSHCVTHVGIGGLLRTVVSRSHQHGWLPGVTAAAWRVCHSSDGRGNAHETAVSCSSPVEQTIAQSREIFSKRSGSWLHMWQECWALRRVQKVEDSFTIWLESKGLIDSDCSSWNHGTQWVELWASIWLLCGSWTRKHIYHWFPKLSKTKETNMHPPTHPHPNRHTHPHTHTRMNIPKHTHTCLCILAWFQDWTSSLDWFLSTWGYHNYDFSGRLTLFLAVLDKQWK